MFSHRPTFYDCEKSTRYLLCGFFRCIKASKEVGTHGNSEECTDEVQETKRLISARAESKPQGGLFMGSPRS